MAPLEIPQLRLLSRAEKILLVQQLWDEIASEPDQFDSPAWHKDALAESAAEYERAPREGSSWTEAKARVLRRLR